MTEQVNLDRHRLVKDIDERSDGMSICVDFSGHNMSETFRAVYLDLEADPAPAEIPLPDDLAAIARRVVRAILDEHEPRWAEGAGSFGGLVLRANDRNAELAYYERSSHHGMDLCAPFADWIKGVDDAASQARR